MRSKKQIKFQTINLKALSKNRNREEFLIVKRAISDQKKELESNHKNCKKQKALSLYH